MLSTPGLAVNERCTESQRFEMTFGHHIELHKPPETALSKHEVPTWIFRLGIDLVMLIMGEVRIHWKSIWAFSFLVSQWMIHRTPCKNEMDYSLSGFRLVSTATAIKWIRWFCGSLTTMVIMKCCIEQWKDLPNM